MNEIVRTPKPPYYAVIFTSIRTANDKGYEQVANDIVRIVSQQKGFLGAESVRDKDGFGMTISYWASMDSINSWKNNAPHQKAKELGKEKWYSQYMIRVCLVNSDNFFAGNHNTKIK